jgi:phosphoribosylformylglycinamidine synthase subunit PurL
VMWQFSEVIDGLTVACNELGTPITGGNVSFYNETLGKSIYPTPVIGMLGVIEDASHVLKIAFREEGDLIVLLDGSGVVRHSENVAPGFSPASAEDATRCEFSSSEYSKTIGGIVSGEPPAIDLATEKRLQGCLVALAAEGAIQSAHDISDGGITVTLAESCFAPVGARRAVPLIGADVKLDEEEPPEAALFGERGARAVVSVRPTSLARVLDTARQYAVGAREIGKVTHDGAFRIEHKGRAVIDSPVDLLRDAWAHSLERTLKVQ